MSSRTTLQIFVNRSSFFFISLKYIELLFGLASAESTAELHACGSGADGSGLVGGTGCPPVSGAVTSVLVSAAGRSSGSCAGPGSWLGPGGALEGGGDDLRGKVQVVTEVLDTLVGQVPVVRAPGELLLDIATGLQRLEETYRKNI